MKRSDYIRGMRDRGWLLWRRGPLTSFMCEHVGCCETRLITDDQIARGSWPKKCPRTHDRGFSATVVQSHEALQQHLRDRRIMLGLSIDDVEAAAGLAVDHVAKLETGKRLPQFPTYFAWAETLGYDICLVPKGLPDPVLAIIDHRAGRAMPSRRPPACLMLPDETSGERSLSALEGIV